MAAVSDETKATLLEVFSMLDRSGTTQIDMREVGYLLNKLCGRNLDEMVLSEIMSEVCDSDAPGQGIDFDSFCAALGPILGESEEELNKRAFSAIDADGSGTVSVAELQPLMSLVAGAQLPESRVKDILSLAAGADGQLRYEDFARAVKDPKAK